MADMVTPSRIMDDEVIDLTTPDTRGRHLPIFRTPESSGSRPAKRRLVFTCSTCNGVEHLSLVRRDPVRETSDVGTQTEPHDTIPQRILDARLAAT